MDYLTPDQLSEMVPTWGDMQWAQRELPPEADMTSPAVAQEVAVKALHRAAMRAGLAGDDAQEFFDRVPLTAVDTLVELMSLGNPTKGGGTP